MAGLVGAIAKACLVLLVLVPAEVHGLILGGVARQPLARPAAAPLGRALTMKSQEDKEFEEWVRQKKIASGVDPDEDFAAGRQAESTIFSVGGIIAVVVPTVAALWAYSEGYLTPQ